LSSGDASSYDLAFQDNDGQYAYNGTRGHEDGQCVLIFDPEREVFVLHRVDSMFNMNLVRTPTNNDAESLQDDYPQLGAHRPSKPSKPANKAGSGKPTKPKKPVAKESTPSTSKKAEPPKPPQPPKPKTIHHDSEDESSDDGLLTIENPGGVAPNTHRDFSPGFIDKPRRFSEFVQQQNEEEGEEDDGVDEVEVEVLNDADCEEEEEEEEDDDDDDDDDEEHFKLPSPITRQINGSGGSNSMGAAAYNPQDVEEEISDEDEDMEDVSAGGAGLVQDDAAVDDNDVDLEAALMAEMAELSQREPELESDVSEEE